MYPRLNDMSLFRRLGDDSLRTEAGRNNENVKGKLPNDADVLSK